MSIRDLVRPHALNGLRPVVIADIIEGNVNSVRAAMSLMRADGEPIPVHSSGVVPSRPRTGFLSFDTRLKIRLAAKERGISYAEMKRQLLEHLAGDDLIDAVLDDRGEAA